MGYYLEDRTMTCVAGIVAGKRVLIAGDSQATAGWDAHYRVESKVFEKGPLVFGSCGSPRDSQLVRYTMAIPEITDVDPFEWMVTRLVESMRTCLATGGTKKVDNSVDSHGSGWLVGFKGRLFSIFSDFQVGERIEGFDARGSGTDYALGALAVSRGTAQKRLVEAVRISAQFNASVGGRIDIVSGGVS